MDTNTLGKRIVSYIRLSRLYKNIYIHSDFKKAVGAGQYFGIKATLRGEPVVLYYTRFGNYNSKMSKAYARFIESDKPVPSSLLGEIKDFSLRD